MTRKGLLRASPHPPDERRIIQLNLPLSILQKLKTNADENCRSMAQEVLYRLIRDMKANDSGE
jgi:hypothetical protein